MMDSPREEEFLAELRTLGGSARHGALRIRLNRHDADSDEVKRKLVERGIVELARGRGGGVRLRSAEASPAAAELSWSSCTR